MNEAYSVLVKIALQNEVSKGLLLMSGQFKKLDQQATAFESRLKNIKSLALVGAGLAASGFFGIHLLNKMIKPAEEYQHQLNIMNMAGLTHKEMVLSIGDAWRNTHNVITATATGGLSSLLDMRNVLGDFQEARKILPLVTKMQAVLQSSTEGSALGSSKTFSQDFAFSVAKSLDIVGAVKNKEEFEKQALLMSQVVTATQGRVTPKMYQSVFAYARQAKMPMDDEFKYRFLPTLMLEYSQSSKGSGGGSRGVGPMLAAMYRWTNQGYVNKASLPLLESLGLIGKNQSLKTTTSGTTLMQGMKGADLAAKKPIIWTQQVLLPAIYQKYGKNIGQDKLMSIINQLTRGNQLAGSVIIEFATKAYAYYRDAAIINKAMTVEKAYQQALISDPGLARTALASQWENVQIALTTPMVTILIPALMHLATGLNQVSQILIKYPTLAKTLSYSLLGLSGTLAFSGTVLLLTTAIKGLGVVVGLMALPITALSAPVLGIIAGLSLVGFGFYKLWQLLKSIDFKPLISGIKGIWGSITSSSASQPSTSPVKIGSKTTLLDILNPVKNRDSQPVQVHSQVSIDGRAVAQTVTQHQVKQASSPNFSSRFDTSLTPVPVGFNF